MEGVISLLSSGQHGQQLTEADLSLRRQHGESATPHLSPWERHATPHRHTTPHLPSLLERALRAIAPQGGAE